MLHLSRLCFEGTRKLKVYILEFNFPWGEFCHVVERKLVNNRLNLTSVPYSMRHGSALLLWASVFPSIKWDQATSLHRVMC